MSETAFGLVSFTVIIVEPKVTTPPMLPVMMALPEGSSVMPLAACCVRVAEGLRPDLAAVRVQLGHEDVAVAGAGEIAAAEVDRARELAGDDGAAPASTAMPCAC